jgi:hypothetical protein
MAIDRSRMYQLPWTPTDNPGGWIEVTDVCDFTCPGCYRQPVAGHAPLAQIEADVLAVRRLTNCDRVAIAGGEPLLHPRILEVVEFIARQGLKPLLLTHGERLTPDLARQLRQAGLVRIQLHVDSAMQRPGWSGKNEAEMNELRQHFADLVWEAGDGGGMQCGFSITVVRPTLTWLPHVLDWCRANLHKVQHVSLVAFRAIPLSDEWDYQVDGRTVDASAVAHATADADRLSVTSETMLDELRDHDRGFRPAVYLPGTTAPQTNKFLVALQIGSATKPYGYLGPRTIEVIQALHHFWTGRYVDFVRSARIGRKVFLLAAVDPVVRRAFKRFVRASLRKPGRALEPVWMQTIAIQQPAEMLRGQANLCGGCPNMMVWQGGLVPSCRLDEYRRFGGPMVAVPRRGVRAELG